MAHTTSGGHQGVTDAKYITHDWIYSLPPYDLSIGIPIEQMRKQAEKLDNLPRVLWLVSECLRPDPHLGLPDSIYIQMLFCEETYS